MSSYFVTIFTLIHCFALSGMALAYIGVCFGGPGQKDLGAGKMLQVAVFVWNERFVFCGW